jgi:hypothetical protein
MVAAQEHAAARFPHTDPHPDHRSPACPESASGGTAVGGERSRAQRARDSASSGSYDRARPVLTALLCAEPHHPLVLASWRGRTRSRTTGARSSRSGKRSAATHDSLLLARVHERARTAQALPRRRSGRRRSVDRLAGRSRLGTPDAPGGSPGSRRTTYAKRFVARPSGGPIVSICCARPPSWSSGGDPRRRSAAALGRRPARRPCA